MSAFALLMLTFLLPNLLAATATAISGSSASPWPAFKHDAKHAGLSQFIGPQTQTVRWIFQTSYNYIYDSSPVISSDGTLYVASEDNKLYAFRDSLASGITSSTSLTVSNTLTLSSSSTKSATTVSTMSTSGSVVQGGPNQWVTGAGPTYSAIKSASVAADGKGNLVFTIVLYGSVPASPGEVYLGYNWNLDTDSNPNTGRNLIANYPVNIGWDYAIEIYWDHRPTTVKPPGQFYGVVINPSGAQTFIDSWKIGGSVINATISPSLIGSSTFDWVAAADGATGYNGQFTGYFLNVVPVSGHTTYSPFAVVGSGVSMTTSSTTRAASSNCPNPPALVTSKLIYAKINTSLGSIGIELFSIAAPETVSNFVNLSKSGFYNNLVWHRIVPGFVIQTGDPLTRNGGGNRSLWGTGGSSKTVPLEIYPSLHNYICYLGMARSSDPNSGSSQFYINLANNTALDDSYTVFGRVISGMDVVDKIAGVQVNANSQPVNPIFMTSISTSLSTATSVSLPTTLPSAGGGSASSILSGGEIALVIVFAAGILSFLVFVRRERARNSPSADASPAGPSSKSGFNVGDLVVHNGRVRRITGRRSASGRWWYDIE